MNRRVAAERERLGLSVRAAAHKGGVSNTTWGRFEETGRLTHKMRVAVAKALDWPTDWPENPPPPSLAIQTIDDDEPREIQELRRSALEAIAVQALMLEEFRRDLRRLEDEVSEMRRPPESGHG